MAARAAASSATATSICDPAPGMVLRSNIEIKVGTLMLCAGHHLTEMTLEKTINFALVSGIKEPLIVESPESYVVPADA